MGTPSQRPSIAAARPWDRRRFLGVAGALGTAGMLTGVLGGCARTPPVPSSDTVALPDNRIGPGSPEVTAAERARQGPDQRAVQVALDAAEGDIDLGGTVVRTWIYNGQLPGPEIRLHRGELLVANLRNQLPQPTAVHWHGIAGRNDMDGVPGLTQPEIAPGAAFRYGFTVPDPGTYWFHPHVGPQLDRGLQAALIVEDPAEPAAYDHDLVVVFDDWLDGTGRTPDRVLADLKAHGMGGMAMAQSAALGGDAGDVTYPHYLANGRLATAARSVTATPGQRIRLRMINAGGDTAFRVGIPGTPMTITHTDGYPVTPTQTEAVLMGMGERIDALITMPDTTTALLGIAEGKTGLAQVLLTTGRGSSPDPAAARAAVMGRPVLLVNNIPAAPPVRLAPRAPDITHELTLAGPDPGYQWTINGQPYDPNHGLPVHHGQRVRLRYTNTTTMFHPMHLHGHTYQINTATGAGPRKDTAIVLPHQSLEVDFDADNPGQWLTHCHNIYHGESAMMTVVSYLA